MSRLSFLRHVISIENKIQAIYDKATREIKKLPLVPASRAEAKAIQEYADQETIEIIRNSVRHGAEVGEEEAIRRALEEMKKRWPK
jgi:hypothetical protein